MELEEALTALVRAVPEAIGAILCDFEGEAVVLSAGAAPLTSAQEASALDHVPRTLDPEGPISRLWLRLAGAAPGAVLHRVQEAHRAPALGPPTLGRGAAVELGFREAHVLIGALPDDYYVLLALRRPALISRARTALCRSLPTLAALLG